MPIMLLPIHSFKLTQKVFFLIMLVVSLFTSNSIVYADNIQAVLQAWQNKNYPQAVKLLKPLAEAGDSRAQYNLGLVYRQQGSEQSRLSRQYLLQSRTGGLIDSYVLMGSTQVLALSSPKAWLFSQNKQFYTLQLATGKIPDYLEKMQSQLLSGKKLEQVKNLSILEVKAQDKQDKNKITIRYILVYGVFNSYQDAKAEVAKLPESLQKSSPWIRQFEALQMIAK